MILSDHDIKNYLSEGKITVKPSVAEGDIRPTGIRLHLGSEILVPVPGQTIDLTNIGSVSYTKLTIPEEGYIIKSGDFILGTTLESCQVSKNIIGQLDGRSTYARLGLTIHVTSEMVDGNFNYPGSTVLEMKNLGPFDLIIKPKMQIGMLLFHQLSSAVDNSDGFKYQNQQSVLPPQGE